MILTLEMPYERALRVRDSHRDRFLLRLERLRDLAGNRLGCSQG